MKTKTRNLLLALAALLVSMSPLYVFKMSLNGGIWQLAAVRLLCAVLAASFLALIFGRDNMMLRPSGVGFSLKKSIYVLSIAILASLLSIKNSAELQNSWIMTLAGSAVLCVFVGLFEEILFRGIVFRSLITGAEGDRKTVIISAIVSSLLFGFLHTLPAFLAGSVNSAGTAGEVLAKTLSAAIVGFLLCALFYKTKSLAGPALIHALNDFFPIAFIRAFSNAGSQFSTGYVTGSKYAAVSALVYTLLLIPCAVIGWKVFKSCFEHKNIDIHD